MKKSILLCFLMLAVTLTLRSQNRYNLGVGVTYSPGLLLELEMENPINENLSLPLRGDVGFFFTEDYNALTFEVHKGFRQYGKSRFFFEQSMGIGAMAAFYKVESIWYYDDFGNVIRYKDGANWGIMPSVSVGCGYKMGGEESSASYLWIRPKVYWNLGFRGLNLPYSAIQIGYSHKL